MRSNWAMVACILFLIGIIPFVFNDVYAITIVQIEDQASCNALPGSETYTASPETCTLNDNHQMPADTLWAATNGVKLVNDATLTVCNDCELHFNTLGVLHRNNGDIQNNGRVVVTGFGIAILENFGSINNKLGSLMEIGGQLNNQVGGVINHNDGGSPSLIITGSLQNQGTMTSTGTITINSGAVLWNNGGTITLDANTLTNGGTLRNEGTFNTDDGDGFGGTITNNGAGTIENTHANALIDNTFGTIQGTGTFNSKIENLDSFTSTITHTVTITNTNLPDDAFDGTPLTVTLNYPAKIFPGQSFTIGSNRDLTLSNGIFTNEGTTHVNSNALVRINSNGQLNNQDTINNAGEVRINTGTSLENSGTFNLLCNGTVTGSGDFNGNPIMNICDTDMDTILDVDDNCVDISNVGQEDTDGSGIGDACNDADDADGDEYETAFDNCPVDANPTQLNTDGDAFGDVCDADDDNDLVLDGSDNCQFIANPLQEDTDGSGIGDACNTAEDPDGDEYEGVLDNCPADANPGQEDTDGSGIGDACNDADDADGDEYETAFDNCPVDANPTQLNTDGDAFGDACDADDDNDNILDEVDDMQTDFSDTFSDGATTSGEIDDRGDQEDELTISDEADPEGVGFDVAAGGGPTSAIVIACNSLAQLSLNSGDSGTITCGSVTVSVNTGSVDVQFNTSSGPATTTMGATDSLTFDGTLKFTNNSLTTPAVITIGGSTFTLAPGETLTITFPSSKTSYQDPNLGDVRHGKGHDNGFCMNQNCMNVDGFFNHFPEKIVPQGSTQTFSLLINCPRGTNTCNHASIEGVLPDSDFYEEQWGVTLDRQVRSDEWDMTINNPYGEIGEVTTSVQEVDQSFLSVSFNIEFLIPGSIGTADGIRVPHENNRFLHVTVWDSNRGISNYIFNEGIYVDDIYVYPKVEASYDAPLEIEKLCVNENINKRYSCAFDKVKQWTIKNAEKALLEINGKTQLDVLNEEFLLKFKELKQAIADEDLDKISELREKLNELGSKIHNQKQ